MTKNMGTADRVVRTLLALAVAVLLLHRQDQRHPRYRARGLCHRVRSLEPRGMVSKLPSLRALNSQAGDRPLVSRLTSACNRQAPPRAKLRRELHSDGGSMKRRIVQGGQVACS